MKELQDDDNNDGNDVGINDVIDIENNNTFEAKRIQVHFLVYQNRNWVRDYTKLVIQEANNLKGDVAYNSYLKEAHKLEEREINGLKVE